MSAVWSPEELANRFAPYIEELHEFFSFHRMPFGSTGDLSVLAERTEKPGHFQAELSALVRSMILREGGAMPHTEVLEVLAIAAGGTNINPTASELQQPLRKLLSFVGAAASRPWNEPPSEPRPGTSARSVPAGDSAPRRDTIARAESEHPTPPAHQQAEDSRHAAAQQHTEATQPQHTHPNNVVPFPVRAQGQRWGQERFLPHHEQRPVTGPDDLPDDIDPNPAEAFATALGARVHAGITPKPRPSPNSARPNQPEQASPHLAQNPAPEAAKEILKLAPALAEAAAPELDSTGDPAMVDGALEQRFGLLEKHPPFAEHAPADPEEFAREQEEAESDPFFAEQPPPSWRNMVVGSGVALALMIGVLVSVHSRGATRALQPTPVRTAAPVASEGPTAVAASQATSTPSAQAKPRKQAKPTPYADPDDDLDSPSSQHSHGREDLIAEPYTSQPFLHSANMTTTFPATAQSRPAASASSAPGNMIASNSAPEQPGVASQVTGAGAAPAIGSSFAGRNAGAPLYRPSAERTYRNPDAALVGELRERTPGTALNDHPRYLSLSSGVMAGNIISAPMPDYPLLAKMAHIHGKVILQAVIDRDGSVSAAKVLSGNRLLRGAAVDAVKQWRYKPYLQQGKPVDVSTIITVEFRTLDGG